MPAVQPSSDMIVPPNSIVVGVAVVGKSNEPLYLCDCEKPWLDLHNETTSATCYDEGLNIDQIKGDNDGADQDPFGFLEQHSRKLEQRNSMSLACQQLIYAALDNLEEKIERPSGKNGQMPVIIRRSTAPLSRDESVHWLGLLLDASASNGHMVYGYITATNIKVLVITKYLMVPTNQVVTKELQVFLQDMHQHYIAYLLNPFCDTRGGSIRSKQFDLKVTASIEKVQQQLNYLLQH
jgi:hypothetical protein